MKSSLDARFSGLTEREAAQRLRAEGPNELPLSGRRHTLQMALEIIREPMFLLLLAAGTIYLVLGELQDALMLLGFVAVVIGITLYQERKTEHALEALRDLSSPRALVIREGVQRRVAGREVVRGDVVILTEGDRVPADAVMLDCSYLLVDESLLTGESVPVRKSPCDDDNVELKPGGDDSPAVFSGTLVVQGQGIALVRATGARTQLGSIGRSLARLEPERAPLEIETGRLVRNLAIAGVALCVLVVVIYQVTRGGWLGGILAGLTLAMAILPEEIPVVLTVFLALGAWRMSRSNALTRRVAAIHALGSTTVLCVDKTGTLTMNRMAVQRIYSRGTTCDVETPNAERQSSNVELRTSHFAGDPSGLPEVCHQTIEYGMLASHVVPFDPMEQAIRGLGDRALAHTEHVHGDWTLVREYPLSRRLLAMSHVWKSPDGSEYVIAAKGAPEAIADLCHLPGATLADISLQVDALAQQGLRVIAVARALFRLTALPGEQHDFDFEFVGLIGFADPVRPGVAEAVADCRNAGIRVVMITGDYPATALNIAREIGLDPATEVITGPELDKMDDAELSRRIRTAGIFARVVPEQKLRLVQALKANREVVVMTGDGVNDAPALKAAHVGIAMGGRGTDVAREAAALVLLDDDFSTIVRAVRQGRRILDNIRKAIAYILGIHVPIAGMSLIPVFLKWPLVLLPVHVVFLELIIDPACSVAFEAEPEEKDVMTRPPRRLDQPLFDRRTVVLSLAQGVVVLAILLAVHAWAQSRGHNPLDARTLTFTAMVIANLSLILTNRSWTRTVFRTLSSPNKALWWVIGGALIFLALVLYVPFLRQLFRFGPFHPNDILVSLSAGVISVVWFEIFKALTSKRAPART